MSNLLALNDRIFAELDRLEQAEGEDLERIVIVPHGGSKNDTLVTVERKVRRG